MSRKDLALMVASFLFGLMLIEIALRALGWSFPIFMEPDSELGWSFRPGLSGWSTHEATAHVRINQFGFRGGEWPAAPLRDGYRIAVIGDSFVDSSSLAEDDAITNVIERDLKTCTALAKPEVLNFGVSGYGTAQEYLVLQRKVAPLRPNLILLAFYVGNDVSNNSRALSIESQKERPYFVESPAGELQLDTSFRQTEAFRKLLSSDWQKRLVNSSLLLQALKQLQQRKPITPPLKEERAEHGDSAEKVILFEPESRESLLPPESEMWREAWSVTEKLLLAMHTWAHERKTEFGLIIIPAPVQALPGEAVRRGAMQTLGLADLDYPVKRLSLFAEQHGVSYLNLLDGLRAYGGREHVFLYGFPPRLGDGHLNKLGSQVAGRLIANWLCQRASVSR